MSIISLSELQSYNLPVDLSGYSPTQLNSMIEQATAWVNGECRHYKGFESHRVVDRIYGRGTNYLFTTFFPILALNSITLIFPPNTGSNVNLPGPNEVPIDPSRVVIDHYGGILRNWSPFVFETIGYMTVFPDTVPINVDYYTGFVNTTLASTLPPASTFIPVSNNSTFFYGQTIRFYDPGANEQVTVLGITTQAGVSAVVTQEPTQYSHVYNTTVGDLPPEVKLSCAFIVCDFATRSLNPENLYSVKLDKFEKTYQRELTVRAKMNTVGSPQIETERPFVKEARRLLEHYYTDRGIN